MAEEKSGEKKRKRSMEEWEALFKSGNWLATELEDDPFAGVEREAGERAPWQKPWQPDEHKKN